MITLYHGSTCPIIHPLAHVGRSDLDFGKGFYMTSLHSQAKRWATRMQLIHAAHEAWLNQYEFDDEFVFPNSAFHCLRFEAYNRQWLEFIVASRNGEEPWREYDVIEGGVANDRVIDTVEDYINGTITIQQALGQLTFNKPNHQICLLNQEVIDKHLYYVDSILLNTNASISL